MTNCTCGAPVASHPTSGYSECGACIEALKTTTVKTGCDWPGCERRIRKFWLGRNFCTAHNKLQRAAFMGICHLEGPQGLNRPLPTMAELAEFARTQALPASRLTPVTFENTRVHCAECGGPLVIVNDHDWSPDLPNAMSCRYTEPGNAGSAQAWGIGICRKCSFKEQAASA